MGHDTDYSSGDVASNDDDGDISSFGDFLESGGKLADDILEDAETAWDQIISETEKGLVIRFAMAEIENRMKSLELNGRNREEYEKFRKEYKTLVRDFPVLGFALLSQINEGLMLSVIMDYWRATTEDVFKKPFREYNVILRQLEELKLRTKNLQIQKLIEYNILQILEIEDYFFQRVDKKSSAISLVIDHICSPEVISKIRSEVGDDELIELIAALIGQNPVSITEFRREILAKLTPMISEWILDMDEEKKSKYALYPRMFLHAQKKTKNVSNSNETQ